MAFEFSVRIGRRKAVETQNMASLPEKVFVERTDDGHTEYSNHPPAQLDKFYQLLNGYYGRQNYLSLFYCLPEVFAPIHEIASRVADANWQLVKDWNDEVDYKDETFNRLFSQPNPIESFKEMIYAAVVYEILTGATFFYANKPDEGLMDLGSKYKNVISWWNLASSCVEAKMNTYVDPYTITELSELVMWWEEANYYNGGKRVFATENVMPIIHRSFEKPFDLNCRKAPIAGAEKPIANLIPVYEARGAIYIKRGAMGFIVSEKSDVTGKQALTKTERKELNKDFQDTYGLTGGKETISATGLPVRFERTAMSIQELEPFEETLQDAVSIYATLRVPRHLVPSKDNSTFSNASSDMKAFYVDTIIPWANKYAQIFTNYFGISRRYIKADFSHIEHLQDDRNKAAEADKTEGETWLQRWQNGTCCLNDWITAVDGTKGTGPLFDKKLPEMTPEEIDQVKAFVTMKGIAPAAAPGTEPGKKDAKQTQSMIEKIIQQLNVIQNGINQKS